MPSKSLVISKAVFFQNVTNKDKVKTGQLRNASKNFIHKIYKIESIRWDLNPRLKIIPYKLEIFPFQVKVFGADPVI
jgi:hypothetical protein